MGHLFLDIETYVSKENENSSLNPYEKESKVILIAYNYYEGFKPPTKQQIKPPTFLKEWESDEKTILTEFYEFLRDTNKNDPYLKITGFNVYKLDLPYLFGRMKRLNIAEEKDLHELLFRPFGIDLFQLSPLISGKTVKHEQLWGISQKDASAFFGLTVKVGTGDECSKFYDRGEYDKIIKYCKEEFNFEQMMDAFYLYILNTLKNKAGNTKG